MEAPPEVKRAAPDRAARDNSTHRSKSSAIRWRGEWSVITTKISTGVDVVFTICDDEASANRVVAQLRNVGCHARVERSRNGDVPGLQRR